MFTCDVPLAASLFLYGLEDEVEMMSPTINAEPIAFVGITYKSYKAHQLKF